MSLKLSTATYLEEVNKVWELIVDRIEEQELDCDSSIIGSVLTVESFDKQQIIINRQEPRHELWLASTAGAYHFIFEDNQWINTATGEVFWKYLDTAFVTIGERKIFEDLY